MKPRILYTKPSITELEVRYATDAAANGWGDRCYDYINRFEAMLVNEGALVLKFWFHLSKDAQKTRLKALEKDPRTAWRVTKSSWDRLKTYDELQAVAGHGA